ncbi:MAG: CoA pyrophosphatase [Ectothiorhodospiraceae bacterium]|nr:CoA pyrophosphatase [Chromatiales bacterium]MCP5153815.1 CoA pyrophosphatase [Ectothiorhodospiraceae bacterium]
MRERILPTLLPLPGAAAATAPQAPTSDYDLTGGRPGAERVLRPAAVLVPLVEHPDGLTVLLTQRTDHLQHHPGQVSFPGGRIEPEDDGPVGAALRETEEEIGLDASYVEVVGCLDDYETVTAYRVTPVVGFVTPGFDLTLDPFEVADAFEVPLAFILDPRNHQTHFRIRDGVRRHYYVFEYGPHYIWGATAGMLMNLSRRFHAELPAAR